MIEIILAVLTIVGVLYILRSKALEQPMIDLINYVAGMKWPVKQALLYMLECDYCIGGWLLLAASFTFTNWLYIFPAYGLLVLTLHLRDALKEEV